MKKTLTLIRRTSCVVAVLLMSWVASVAQAADGIPERPYPPRLVNDMAGVFSESAAAQLEDSLVAFSKQTSNQVEGALPDAFCNRIVEDKMIPILKEGNNYTAATWAALKVIMPVCRGEYDYETYQSDEDLSLFDWICVIAILLVFIGFRIFLPFGGGSFTSGSSGSSGGFDFGGGSFGGGGAGGSW